MDILNKYEKANGAMKVVLLASIKGHLELSLRKSIQVAFFLCHKPNPMSIIKIKLEGYHDPNRST